MNNRRTCSKCVMPESPPWITLDESGVCNLCHKYESEKETQKKDEGRLFESDLVKIFNKYKGKNKYDCLVMCSGGKDSTSALYFIKKRYKLNPLAFTFDHGFETKEALDNIHKAVEKLGVDFLFFRSEFMKDMFKKIHETNSKAVICHPCSIWYMSLTYDIAARFEIPIIIAGWTKGQSMRKEVMSKCACNISEPEFVAMGEATQEFIEKHLKTDPKYKDFPASMEEVLKRAKKKTNAMVISPHWFLPIGQEAYVDIIKKELDWKQPEYSYPGRSTNCELNFLSSYNSLKHYGYTHYHVEMSKLIREGLLTRDQALKDLEWTLSEEAIAQIGKKLEREN